MDFINEMDWRGMIHDTTPDQVLNKINRYKKILRKQQNIACACAQCGRLEYVLT